MKRFALRFLLLTALLTAGCAQPTTITATTSATPVATTAPIHSPRSDFLTLIDRPRIPLDPQTTDQPTINGLTEIRFSYLSEPTQRVPGILLKPANAPGKLPVIIDLHGTGGSKNGELPLLRRLAQSGFIAIAIDARYHGERATSRATKPNSYESAILTAWQSPPSTPHEHPFFYDTVWDVIRLLDYLQTRPDVDPTRIGLIGTSKGGIETYFTAAVDLRIAVAIPMIAVQSFRWELDNNDWKGRIATIQPAFDAAAKLSNITTPDSAFVQSFYDRVVPHIYDEFDCPSMLPLIAPRPLMIINGDKDPNCPLPGAKLAIAAAQSAYHEKNADDRLTIKIQPNTPHRVNPDSQTEAIAWFVKWLKPDSPALRPTTTPSR